MDIGRAYTYMFSDPKWISKVLIAAAVSLVPILNLALAGYGLAIVKRVYDGLEPPMPEWDDFGDYFVRGLLVTAGVFIWLIPIYVVMFCPILALLLIDDSGTLAIIGGICLVPLVLIGVAVVLQVAVARYALTNEFSSMFQFGEVLSEARRGIGVLLLCVLAYVLASIIGLFASVLTCFIGFFFLSAWLTLAQSHLLGQAYRRVRALPTAPVTAF